MPWPSGDLLAEAEERLLANRTSLPGCGGAGRGGDACGRVALRVCVRVRVNHRMLVQCTHHSCVERSSSGPESTPAALAGDCPEVNTSSIADQPQWLG